MSAPALGDFRVGAARVDITPPADPANPPSGKYAHERLYVRAIVLDNGSARAALIGADQGMLYTVVVTLANERANSGYIANDAAFGAFTFQVLSSRLKPACAETTIVNGWLDLLGDS
jgi:hypothetical protein